MGKMNTPINAAPVLHVLEDARGTTMLMRCRMNEARVRGGEDRGTLRVAGFLARMLLQALPKALVEGQYHIPITWSEPKGTGRKPKTR